MYILIILLSISIIFNILLKRKNNKKIDLIKEEIYNTEKDNIQKLKEKETDKLNKEIEERKLEISKTIQDKQADANIIISALEKSKEDAQRANNEIINISIDSTKERIKNIVKDYSNELAHELEAIREDAETELESIISANQIKIDEAYLTLAQIEREITDFKAKREVINQEIMRKRQVEENENFYKVQLTEEAKSDMIILKSILPQLSNKEALRKVMYDTYVSKNAAEMIKRVLHGTAPSGIYKITRLSTGEIYIGKSSDVKARWGQHLKTAFGVGTIAHSVLHTTMEKDGIENFTFELLEEVEKDKLGAREKFWIDFYGSKQYGLNERQG